MKKRSLSFETSSFFEYIFENSKHNAIIVMDEGGFIITLNKAFTFFFGYSHRDLAGKNFNVLFLPEDRMKNLPERELQNVKEFGSSEDTNYTVHKNGRLLWVTGESVSVETGNKVKLVVKIFQNVNEQKRLEFSLQEANAFTESILHHISDLIVVVDGDIRILKANGSFLHYFRLTPDTAEGAVFDSLLDDAHREQFREIIRMHGRQNAFQPYEIEFYSIEGKRRVFSVHVKRMDMYTYMYQSKEEKFLIIFHEITLERTIQEQREDLIGFVAHELRNPLTSISLGSELLLQSVKQQDTQGALSLIGRIQSNLLRVNTIINDLSELTKVESGHLKIEKAEFAFDNMIEDVISSTRIMYPQHNFVQEGNINVKVIGDRWRLSQVLLNYLGNAVKYGASEKISLMVFRKGNDLVVGVRDYGPGIPADKIPYVFNKYYRVKKTSRAEGTGLGLYISKEIVNAHGGKVWVESREGEGAVFYFSIPVACELE